MTSPSPKMGVPYAPKIREWPYLRNGPTGDPIHFMFGSSVGFSRSADRMAAILDNFEWPYLRNGSFNPLRSASLGHLCDSTASLFF